MTPAARLLFCLSLAVIAYTYAGYPLAVYLLARLRPRSWRRAPWPLPPETPPPVSVIMAVHNGARALPGQLDHLLTLDPHLIREVLVVDDGSIDSTATILQSNPNPRLRPILLPRQAGKASALNPAIAAATGEILLFVDIRPRISPGALDALLSNFADPSVGCVAGELLLTTGTHDATTSAVSGLYWRYEQGIRNCEAAIDSPVGVYGGFYAIRRALATPNPAGVILDDMFQPLSVIRQGYRSVLERTAFVTDTWPTSTAGEFNRKVRTLAGNYQLIALAPWLLTPRNRLVIQLISHKLLRLVVPYLFALLLATTAVLAATVQSRPEALAFALFGLAQTAFWFLAALSLRVRILGRIPILGRIAAPAGALLVLNAAAVAALYTFLFTRGPLWKIWSPTPHQTSTTPTQPPLHPTPDL